MRNITKKNYSYLRTLLNITSIIYLNISFVSAIETKLTANNGSPLDQFGISCAIDGDILVVGAQRANSGTGSAYIFYRNILQPNSWTEQIEITADDAANGDRFGASAAIDGDYIVIGAPRDNNRTGSAYVFYRNEGGSDNWGQQAKLTSDDGVEGDDFGISVSISGEDIIIGANYADLGDSLDAGAAYIFNKDQGGTNTWGQTNKLVAGDYQPNDWYGYSVSISDDYIVVGAWGEDFSGDNSGAAYFHYRDQGGSGNWGQTVKRTPDIPGAAHLGYAVSMDGINAIVSAKFDNDVYFYSKDEGGQNNWGQLIKISRSSKTDSYGFSVSINNNFAFIGDPLDDHSSMSNAGSGVSFLYNGTTWITKTTILASDASNDAQLGISVCVSSNFGVIGTPFENSNIGAVYIYENSSDLALPVELANFNVIESQLSVLLTWQTKSEIENQGFIVYKSTDNAQYAELSSYKYDEELEGLYTSSTGKNYEYVDYDVKPGNDYWYKLADVSTNGFITEHDPIHIRVGGLPVEHTLISTYPNPFNPRATIQIENVNTNGIADEEVRLVVYNQLGQKIKTIYRGILAAGRHKFSWDAKTYYGENVVTGIYYLLLDKNNGNERYIHKIVYLK